MREGHSDTVAEVDAVLMTLRTAWLEEVDAGGPHTLSSILSSLSCMSRDEREALVRLFNKSSLPADSVAPFSATRNIDPVRSSSIPEERGDASEPKAIATEAQDENSRSAAQYTITGFLKLHESSEDYDRCSDAEFEDYILGCHAQGVWKSLAPDDAAYCLQGILGYVQRGCFAPGADHFESRFADNQRRQFLYEVFSRELEHSVLETLHYRCSESSFYVNSYTIEFVLPNRIAVSVNTVVNNCNDYLEGYREFAQAIEVVDVIRTLVSVASTSLQQQGGGA